MRREILGLLPLVCSMLFYCGGVNAQNSSEAFTNVELIIEKIVSNTILEEDSNHQYCSELTNFLLYIAANGLLANISGVDELLYNGVLTSFEAASLKSYIRVHGEPLSYAEFLLIPGLDREKIELLRPFLRFDNLYYVNQGPSRFYSSLLLRCAFIPESREGYLPISKEEYLKKPESRYLGNFLSLYGQYRVDAPGNISAIITTEKDAGERGLDFISWSASVKNRGVLENLVIGSYTARKGQGLILWNGFSLNSSWDPAGTIKRDYGITPYTSAQEDRAFKGIAATISKGCLSFDILTSFRNYDARTTDAGYTSLLTTGLHNTPLTLQRKGALHTNMLAVSMSYNNEVFKTGVIVSGLCNSLPYAGRDSSLILMEQKLGSYRANAGINWSYLNKRSLFSGEVAFDMCGNAAAVTGVAVRLKSGSELSIISKYYSPLFVSPLSYISKIPGKERVLSEVSGKFLLSKSVVLYAAATLSKSYNKVVIKCDISTKNGAKNDLRVSLYKDRANIRADYRKELSKTVLLHSRVDFSRCSNEDGFSLGYLVQQELVARTLKERVALSCRLSWFSAPLWGNRIYSYERDVLNQFRTTVIYGEGLRWYVNTKASLGPRVDMWLKYSSTYYTDRDEIGEGPEKIFGPSKSEVKIQLRVKF